MIEQRIRWHLEPCHGSLRVNETPIKVKDAWIIFIGRWIAWTNVTNFRLSPKREIAAAKRFFSRVVSQSDVVKPCTVTENKNRACPPQHTS